MGSSSVYKYEHQRAIKNALLNKIFSGSRSNKTSNSKRYRSYSSRSYNYSYQQEDIDYEKQYKDYLQNMYYQRRDDLNESLSNTINQIQKQCKLSQDLFKNIHQLVDILKEKQNQIMKDFTFKVYQSSMDKIEQQVQEFNELSLKVREFFKTLDLEQKEGFSLQSYDALIKSTPKECQDLIQEIKELGKKEIHQKIQEYEKTSDFKKIEEYYSEIPSSFSEERNKIANTLLKQQLQEQKAKEENIKKEIEEQERIEKIQKLKQEAEKFYQKLSQLSKSEAEKIQNNIEEVKESQDQIRISYITKDIKIRYAKLKRQYIESEALKEDIKNHYLDFPNAEVQKQIEEFLNKELVTKDEYNQLIEHINEAILKEEEANLLEEKKAKMIYLIHENLKKLGYSVIDEATMEKLQKGEVVEIQTPFGEDYSVRLKVEKDSLAMRFIRYVDNESQLSTYEKEKDVSVAKKWCNTYDNIIKHLKDNGILLQQEHHLEPEKKFYYEKKEKLQERLQQQKRQDLYKKNL